jgi:hypothetical protein
MQPHPTRDVCPARRRSRPAAGGPHLAASLPGPPAVPRMYCINGRTSELVAAPVPAAELATLAARLPPA